MSNGDTFGAVRYLAKSVTVTHFDLRTANRTNFGVVRYTFSHQNWYGVSINVEKCVSRSLNKTDNVPLLVRCGSRSDNKKRTVEMNGSVRFTLLIGTVTVATRDRRKKQYGKLNEKRTRYHTDTVSYGHGTVRTRWKIRIHYFIDAHLRSIQ